MFLAFDIIEVDRIVHLCFKDLIEIDLEGQCEGSHLEIERNLKE